RHVARDKHQPDRQRLAPSDDSPFLNALFGGGIGTRFSQGEQSRVWVHSAGGIKYGIFVRVVNGTSSHEIGDERGFAAEAASGDQDGAIVPGDHARMHEESVAGMLRD